MTDSHTHTTAIYLEKKGLIHPPWKLSKLEKIVHNEYSLNVNRISVPPAKKNARRKGVTHSLVKSLENL